MPPISSILPVARPEPITAPGTVSQPGEFQKVLEGAIHSVESLQQEAAGSVEKFLSGENEELHTVILATEKAQLAFELGLQVRNKVVNAYQEIMRMQI